MRKTFLCSLLFYSSFLFSDLKHELIALEDQLADIATLAKEDPSAREIQERLDEIIKMADTNARFKDIEETLLTITTQSEKSTVVENRVEDLQVQVDELRGRLESIISQNALGDCGVALNPGRPCAQEGLIVSLAYLYWQAFATEAEYAYAYTPGSNGAFPGVTLPLSGESRNIKFNYKSGIRAGLGYTLPWDGWDLNLIYTYFAPTHRGTVQAEALFPLYAYQAVAQADSVTSAHTRWRLRYQTLDGEWGRAFFVSPKMCLRPHMAIRGGWFDQNFEIDYAGGDLNGALYEIEARSDFSGAGLRGGFNTTWFWGYGFHLFSDLAASLLFGSFDIRQKHSESAISVAELSYDRARLIPGADLQAGLGWQIWFNQGRNCFRLRFSYEMQYLWALGQQSHYIDSAAPLIIRSAQDIGFQGLTIEGRMDF